MQSYMSFTIVNYNCYVIVHRVTIYWRESNTNLLVSRTRHRLLDVGTNALLTRTNTIKPTTRQSQSLLLKSLSSLSSLSSSSLLLNSFLAAWYHLRFSQSLSVANVLLEFVVLRSTRYFCLPSEITSFGSRVLMLVLDGLAVTAAAGFASSSIISTSSPESKSSELESSSESSPS